MIKPIPGNTEWPWSQLRLGRSVNGSEQNDWDSQSGSSTSFRSSLRAGLRTGISKQNERRNIPSPASQHKLLSRLPSQSLWPDDSLSQRSCSFSCLPPCPYRLSFSNWSRATLSTDRLFCLSKIGDHQWPMPTYTTFRTPPSFFDFEKLRKFRSRLYRGRFLKANTYFARFLGIYMLFTIMHPSSLRNYKTSCKHCTCS